MKGLAVPVGVTKAGTARMAEGEENDKVVLFSSLADCDSDNAFQQDLGLGSEMVYGTPTEALKSQIRRRLNVVFAYWESEERFRLMPESIRWIEGDGELSLEFRYMNLETDEVQSFALNLK